MPINGRFEHVVLSCNIISDRAIVWIEREAQRAFFDVNLQSKPIVDPHIFGILHPLDITVYIPVSSVDVLCLWGFDEVKISICSHIGHSFSLQITSFCNICSSDLTIFAVSLFKCVSNALDSIHNQNEWSVGKYLDML